MLRFIDSFDHWTNTFYARKWDNVSFDFFGTIGITTGRFGNGFSVNPDTAQVLRKTLDAQGTWILGVALYRSAIDEGGILRLYDSGTVQLQLQFRSDGRLDAVRGTSTVLGTGTQILTAGAWHYVEAKYVIHNSTGSVEVKIDGVTDINLTGQDTQATANATADQVGPYGGGNTVQAPVIFDDFYACDGVDSGVVGAPNNDFLGDVRVEALFPNGNGTTSDLLGSDADSTDNYLLVDETIPDDDTTYVESSTIGDRDTYAYTNATATSGTVYGAVLYPLARKTDAGTKTICSIARLAATEVDSADRTLSVSYQYFPDVHEEKPGGGAWTIADINNAEFGVKVTS